MNLHPALALWILLGSAAMAQTPQPGIWMGSGPTADAPAVQNAPFSAELVNVIDRTVDGGPGFHRTTEGKVARSSQGQTYMEMQLASPSPDINKGTRITITDPAQHSTVSLDPQAKTAFVSQGANRGGRALTPGSAGNANFPGTAAAAPHAAEPNPPAAAVITPRASPGQFSGPAGEAKTTSEKLGSKVIEGLTVTGVRTISTSSWNVSGGETKAFTITTETWTSPELQAVVLRESTDSMGTHQLSKLVNIVRTEPDASLFQIPAGYRVKDFTPRASAGSAR